MKQEWKPPVLESLNINQTMAGPGKAIKDLVQYDEDDPVNYS